MWVRKNERWNSYSIFVLKEMRVKYTWKGRYRLPWEAIPLTGAGEDERRMSPMKKEGERENVSSTS